MSCFNLADAYIQLCPYTTVFFRFSLVYEHLGNYYAWNCSEHTLFYFLVYRRKGFSWVCTGVELLNYMCQAVFLPEPLFKRFVGPHPLQHLVLLDFFSQLTSIMVSAK